jgi:biopolymer transport protein ExbD
MVELNVMPFIDIFSLLCTFLLFTAVFVSIGIHEVQIPFLTNASDPNSKNKPERTLELAVHIEEDSIELEKSYTMPPVDKTRDNYPKNDEGVLDLHKKLVELKVQNPSLESAKLYSDENTTVDFLVKVLDSVRLKHEGDPELFNESGKQSEDLIPKVIMGDVIF